MKNTRLNELIGSPCYPSPLDRIRSGKRERAAQFGLNIQNEESFEVNQSFPRAQLNTKSNNDLSPLNKFLNHTELNSVSFLPSYKKNFKKFNKLKNISTTNTTNNAATSTIASTTTTTTTIGGTSCNTTKNNDLENSFGFDKSWQFYNYFANSDAILCDEQNVTKNPNKALVTINGRNSEILTANDTACELFSYNEDKLIGMKLKDLLDINCHHKHDVIMESHLDNTGNLVLCSGKLFDAIDSNGIVIPISIYMQKLNYDHEPICLCMIEPVQRITGNFSINVKGRLKSFDDKFLSIFGYINKKESTYGKDINELIPKIKLPMCSINNDIRKQTLTGRTINDITIPLTVRILNKQLFNNEEIVFNGIVSFYTNISGLITIRLADGLINSYNPIFTRILFGYDDETLKNKPISLLIPNFYDPNSDINNIDVNESGRHDEENDELINKNLNRMLYDDEFNDENHKKFKPNDENSSQFERSFNSKSIDSTNLSIKSTEFTFNTTANVTNYKENDDIDIDDEEDDDDDDDSTMKYCYNCGCELKFKRQTDHILNEIIKTANTPIAKCTSFIKKHDFSKVINDNSVLSTSTTTANHGSSFFNNTTAFDESKLAQNSLNISEYQDKYICDTCIEKINAGKSILPLKETVFINNESNICEDDTNHDDDDDDDTSNDVSLTNGIEIDDDQKSNNFNNIPVISITPALDESLAKKNYLKTRLNILKANNSTNNGVNGNVNLAQVTSTPAPNEDRLKMSTINKNNFIREGTFYGNGKHKDGSLIQIIYQRKIIEISNDKSLVCIWICKDPETDKSMMEQSLDQSQLKKSFINDNSLILPQTTTTGLNQYSFEYEDMKLLGRGASGFVQFARRKQDAFEVVTKYIRKTKIHKDNWINDERYGQIPLEISILCKLDHANIIKVLEVFQDNDYIQMVMEKHGCGMDLFEFIDRQPNIDEPLASYIFRQLVSAVSYLHSNNIVHRDIKDENIVINEAFHIKLIDFGSAAYMVKGKKFATFCGTLDYCSPEVLLGNKYYGPELDCWTIGIALYTLVFAENPFFDADETIECILKPPFKVSKELMKLLFSILYPKPELRATIKDIETNEWVTQNVDITKYKWEFIVKNTIFNGNNAGDCRFGESDTNESEIEHTNVLKAKENLNEIAKTDKINNNDKKPIKKSSNSLTSIANSNLHSKSF